MHKNCDVVSFQLVIDDHGPATLLSCHFDIHATAVAATLLRITGLYVAWANP